MSKVILTATDLSDWAKNAEAKGAMLAKSLGDAEMLLVHVMEQRGSAFGMDSSNTILNKELVQSEAHKALEEAAAKLSEQEGVNVTPVVRSGDVTEEIKALIKEKKADLLVIGAHGQGYHFLPVVGNIPAKLLQGSDCPALIIRSIEKKPYKKILIPVDFSEVSVNQVKQALTFLPEDAEITLMSICESPSSGLNFYSNVDPSVLEAYRNTLRSKGQEKMDQLVQKLGTGRTFKTHLEIGVPHKAILSYAKVNNFDMLVLGKHHRLRLEDYLIGSTIHYAINEAECDVLITTSVTI